MNRVFIALGANLNQPLLQIKAAQAALTKLAHPNKVYHSPLYQSQPMGPAEQPCFINGVSMFDTELSPLALLDALQTIEQQQGRVRKAERWGPRTLDLDMLLYGSLIYEDERLTLPHYDMKQRAFVLYPLADLAPDLVLPCGTPLAQLLLSCQADGITQLPSQ